MPRGAYAQLLLVKRRRLSIYLDAIDLGKIIHHAREWALKISRKIALDTVTFRYVWTFITLTSAVMNRCFIVVTLAVGETGTVRFMVKLDYRA